MDKETDSLIEQYRARLVKMGIVPERLVVFGSYASGDACEGSDLDLMVIASQFEGMDLWERLAVLGRARAGINRPMEILGLTPDEADGSEAGSFVDREVLEKGVTVA